MRLSISSTLFFISVSLFLLMTTLFDRAEQSDLSVL